MNSSIQVETAVVLNRDLRGENNLYIEALAPDLGILRMMKKISARKTSSMPDIFDDISARLDSDTPAGLKFVREYEILHRRAEIGKSYEALEQASLIARCIIRNGVYIENSVRLHSLAAKALDAIADSLAPEIVRLKFMYAFARGEGYAVREDFFDRLPDSKKILFAALVKTPTAQLAEFRSRASDILGELCDWIYANTDIQSD